MRVVHLLGSACLLAIALAFAAPASARRDQPVLVSQTSGGVAGDSDSAGGSISADGRMVAFVSRATNLSTIANTLKTKVFHVRAHGRTQVRLTIPSGQRRPHGLKLRLVATVTDPSGLSRIVHKNVTVSNPSERATTDDRVRLRTR